jgi:mannose-6-phosphate isomerase-like protein (cupin superfamily)
MKTKRLPIMTGNPLIDNELSGEWLQSRPGERFSIRVPASATNGSYSVTEILSSPGDSTPVHLHENEDEHILVVEGTARVLYGEKMFDATAGTMVSLPRGIPHAWGNPTDTPIRLMITARPGGVEEVLRLIATSSDQLELLALSNKYAVRLIGPPLLGTGHRERG